MVSMIIRMTMIISMIMSINIYDLDHDAYDHKISLPSQLSYLSIHGQDNDDDNEDIDHF